MIKEEEYSIEIESELLNEDIDDLEFEPVVSKGDDDEEAAEEFDY